jgi:hypothetical protein
VLAQSDCERMNEEETPREPLMKERGESTNTTLSSYPGAVEVAETESQPQSQCSANW